MLNLLLGQDLLAEASPWKVAPGQTLQVSVAGDSQPQKTQNSLCSGGRTKGAGARKSRIISRKSSHCLIYLLQRSQNVTRPPETPSSAEGELP